LILGIIVRENLEGGILKFEFVKSIENKLDIFTKNGIEEFNENLVKFKEYIKEYSNEHGD
jgi:hypothetical protein